MRPSKYIPSGSTLLSTEIYRMLSMDVSVSLVKEISSSYGVPDIAGDIPSKQNSGFVLGFSYSN